MKRFYLVALVLLACGAGFFGGEIRETLSPEPVYAQPPRATAGIRIALFNLEKAARSSKLFSTRKGDWDKAQEALRLQNEKMQRDYKLKEEEAKRARLANPDDDVLSLRVELQAIDQALKVAEKEQQEYLGALLAQYQKEVLIQVMEALNTYITLMEYDIVLQDYEDAAENADFFSGAAYAQSLMSKPVLAAQGIALNKNPYVTDITDAIIERMK
jgi:Skp family chaperone for outer membrane proteins